jgi:hypothetical protein
MKRQERQLDNPSFCNISIFADHRADVSRIEDSPDMGFGEALRQCQGKCKLRSGSA